MKSKEKTSLIDWRFVIGIISLIFGLLFLAIALILVSVAFFNDNFNNYLGNGWWVIKNNSLNQLLFHWTNLDDQAAIKLNISHPYYQVFVALIFLLFVTPLLVVLGIGLMFYWWSKTRI